MEKLKKRIVSGDEATELLRDMILSGKLKPRERLIESELSESLKMSRTPIRQAIQRLSVLGLVIAEPYCGAAVADLDTKKIREIYAVRILLESFAARLATPNISCEALNEMSSILDEMEILKNYADRFKRRELNERFHRIIYTNCGNSVLAGVIGQLWDQSALFRHTSMEIKKNITRTSKEHRMIFEAMRKRDAEKAGKFMSDHIRVFLANSEEYFD